MTAQLLLDAVAFAARAHDGHLRKDGVTPYVSHPFRVCMIVRDAFGFDDPRMLIAALLHDTIEDTTTDFDEVAERFGSEIATWVALLSKDKRLPEPKREQAYLAALKGAPWQVQVCKLADLFDNLSDIQQLPVERRAHSVARAEFYFAMLRESTAPEMARPIELVEQMLRDVAPTTSAIS